MKCPDCNGVGYLPVVSWGGRDPGVECIRCGGEKVIDDPVPPPLPYQVLEERLTAAEQRVAALEKFMEDLGAGHG